ncbi:MAG: hypothetical protein B7O98_03850 [Zestosphaera tikiterensis]|uniref:DUF2299 domain-containing protein n=1 Tax=Zestosphaera tikiterensis TaxID=1973259 RepID=A0A2R7Y7P7_9CREN|nr:MAG: hypothetical protein B7O98_03850 [Zestosphaera tikiterensis]
MKGRDLVSKWLVEEGFEIRKFEGGVTPLKVVWGLDVFTPPPKLNIKIVQYEGREDRYFLLLGVGISPEHRRELDRLNVEGRLRFSSKLVSRVLSVCNISDLLPVLRGGFPLRAVHWFGGTCFFIHLRAGLPAHYPYP